MAWNTPEKYDDGTATTIGKNSFATRTIVGKLGPQSGAPSLKMLTPLAWDESTGKWNVWGGTSEVQTITIDATGGTFTISFDGETTTALAYNASAATVQAALEALSNIDPGDVTVALATLVYTITFAGKYRQLNVPALTTGAGSLTGGASTATVATGTAGENLGRRAIRGFLWGDTPEDLVTDATDDTLATIMVEGDVYYSEIQLPSGETEAALKIALRDGPRQFNLRIHELADVR